MAKTSQNNDGTDLCIIPPRGWSGSLFFTTDQGRKIRYASAPAHGVSRGTVVLTHGYSEHAELLFEVIHEYQKMGFDVWTMDWHGQGFSGRTSAKDTLPCNEDKMSDHVADLHEFATRIVARDKSKPMILSTNSMGGHVGMLYLQQYPETFNASVMAAPMLDIYRLNMPVYLRAMVRALFHLVCALGLARTPVPTFAGLCDRFNLAALGIDAHKNDSPRQKRNHALRNHFKAAQISLPSFGWIRNSFETADHMMKPENLAKVSIPVLLGTGGKDKLVDAETHDRAVKSMPQCTHAVFNHAAHNLWFEQDNAYNLWRSQVSGFMEGVVNNYQNRAYQPCPLAA